jgi:hypothetical protein
MVLVNQEKLALLALQIVGFAKNQMALLAPRLPNVRADIVFIIFVVLCLNIAGMTIATAVNLVRIVLRTAVHVGLFAETVLANQEKAVQAVPLIAELASRRKSPMKRPAALRRNAKAVIALSACAYQPAIVATALAIHGKIVLFVQEIARCAQQKNMANHAL